MPRWWAIIRLPNPAMVVSPLTITAITVLRATNGPPWRCPSMYRIVMFSPNSAAVPTISGIPQTLARLNFRLKRYMRPTVHSVPRASGIRANAVSRSRCSMRKARRPTRTNA